MWSELASNARSVTMRVAFSSSEVYPFIKTGGLADVCGSLPIALEKLGIDTVVFLPYFRSIDRVKFNIERLNNQYARAIIGHGIEVYFIQSDLFFSREGVYGDFYGDYADNLQRFQFFSLKVLEAIKQLKLDVDIMHCHDWQSALIPVYLKTKFAHDQHFKNMKSVLTIHNLAYQGHFSKEEYAHLGLSSEYFNEKYFEFYDKINLLKAGIALSDTVTTVSTQYAKEILTKEFGCGLEGVLKQRKDGVTGITNGIDYAVWNPEEDPAIAKTYSVDTVTDGKSKNKAQLQKSLKLPVNDNIPLYGFVGRLSHQKGMDLILPWLRSKEAEGVQVLLQGLGDEKYARELKEIEKLYPERFRLRLAYDENMAHRIYASSDLFLMPSNFEPCGLSQMIAMRYGSIPIVYKTGGLVDTVMPLGHLEETGIIFEKYDLTAFKKAISDGVKIFQEKERLNILRHHAMRRDFSWQHSAQEYEKIYQCLLSDLQEA